jgi:hypothetical protein
VKRQNNKTESKPETETLTERQKGTKMATKVRFTRESLLMNRLLDPGWYPMKVKKVTEKPSKKDGSINWISHLENLRPGDDQGVVVQRYFNEKPEAIGFAKPYFEAFGIDPEADVEYDIYQTEGERLEVYVDRGKDDKDNPTNVAMYFRPWGSSEVSTSLEATVTA